MKTLLNPAPYSPDLSTIVALVYASYMLFSVVAYILIIWGLYDLKEEIKKLRTGEKKDE